MNSLLFEINYIKINKKQKFTTKNMVLLLKENNF